MGLERRVVITGMGVCTPIGNDVDTLWKSLLEGRSNVRDIDLIDPVYDGTKSKVASYFTDDEVTPKALGLEGIRDSRKRMMRNSRIALNAAIEAVEDSGFLAGMTSDDIEVVKERSGVSIAAGFGGISGIEENTLVSYGHKKVGGNSGMGSIDRFLALKTIPGAAPAYIEHHFDLHAGGMTSPAGACASGVVSMIEGFKDIRRGDPKIRGDADTYIVGGTGEISVISFGSFDRAGTLTSKGVSRPFDRNRDGFLFGEGAGVLILEELEKAKSRGATIYAELLGYGLMSDGNSSLTAPREDGRYAIQAIRNALEMAGIGPEDIDYINAHGTSTLLNDKTESKVIREALGDYSYKPWINSSKSMLGHTLNAAGSLEAIITIKSIYEGKVHQTKNLFHPDVDNGCDLCYAGDSQNVDVDINYALSNSFGFGGRNAILVFGKYKGD